MWVHEKIKKLDISGVDVVLGIACLASSLYFMLDIVVNLESDGTLCPRVMVCAESQLQVFLLCMSRATAGILYPSTIIVIVTKLAFLRHWLNRSFLSELIDFSELHEIHRRFGTLLWYAAVVHSIAHIIRLLIRKQSDDLLHHPTGWSGIAGISLLFVIVPPMLYEWIRATLDYEPRKLVHYVSIAWLEVLSYHTNTMEVVHLTLLILYVVDFSLSTLFLTFKVEHAEFEPIGQGVAIKFAVPKGMNTSAGQFVYVNIPWISVWQWHAFSFIVDEQTHTGSLYLDSVGDWTTRLYQLTIALKHRPVLWLNGSHPSPFMHSVSYSRIVLIASGGGITPAISVVEQYHSQREIHLIFITRDIDMLKFFLPQLGKVRSYIFYTGSSPLEPHLEDFHLRIADEETQKSLANYVSREFEVQVVPDENEDVIEEVSLLEKLPDEEHVERVTVNASRPDLPALISDILKDSRREQLRELMTERMANVNVSFMNRMGVNPIMSDMAGGYSDKAVLYCGASKTLDAVIEDACQEQEIAYISEYFTQW